MYLGGLPIQHPSGVLSTEKLVDSSTLLAECCNKSHREHLNDNGRKCHAQCQRGTGCETVWLDTLVELVYDGVEGSMYVIGAWTAMVSRTLSSDFKKTWRIVDFQTGGPTMSPLLLMYMYWKSNMTFTRENHSILLAVHPWHQAAMGCHLVTPI